MVILALGSALADSETTAPVSNEITSATVADLSTTASESASTGSSSLDIATSSGDSLTTVITPLEGLTSLKMSEQWQNRMRDLGITPESFWIAKPVPETQEEKDAMMASRHYFMGWYYIELGQEGRAVEQFSQALTFDPENPHILLDAARARLAVHEISEARDLITKVLDRESTNVEALRLQADAYMASADAAQGDEKESLLKSAVDSLEKAHKIQPNNLDVLRGLAKTYVQQQDVEKVIAAYRDIVKVDPRDTYSLLILAQVLSRMERPEEAIEYYQRVIEQRRGFIGGYIYLGQLYERLKRYGDALELYKQALLVEPRNVDVLRRFEDLLRQMNGATNPDKILAAYKKFAEEYPANTETRRIYAERLEGEEKRDEAIAQYEQILKIDPENSDALMALGKIYSDKKDYGKAAEYLNKAVEINPDKVDLYDAIANTFLARADKAEAVSVYKKAIEANPNAEKLYISLAALLEDDKQTTQAIKVMEKAVSKVGDKPELLAVLGKFYRSEDDYAKAEKTLRKAYDLESDNLPLFGELISLYLEEGNTTSAAEITSRTAAGSATAKDVVLSVAAEFYFNTGRTEKAIELYLQALDANSTKLDYLARLVGISNRQKLYDRSLEYLEKYSPKMKDQDKVQQLKAEIFLAAKRFDEAIAIYRNLLRENPLDLNYYQYLVDAYNEAGRFDESVKVVKEARSKFGNSDPEAVEMMAGMVYYKKKDYTQAEKSFQTLIKESKSKSDDAYYFLGSVYLDQEKYDQAEKQFRKAIDVNPNSANALNALGFMYADRGIKLKEAKELISKALDINPSAPHILDSMGWVLFKDGDLKGAEEYIQRASRQYEDAEILDHLGEIYAQQGKKAQARQMFERVLELDPKRVEVKKKLDDLQTNGQN